MPSQVTFVSKRSPFDVGSVIALMLTISFLRGSTTDSFGFDTSALCALRLRRWSEGPEPYPRIRKYFESKERRLIQLARVEVQFKSS